MNTQKIYEKYEWKEDKRDNKLTAGLKRVHNESLKDALEETKKK